MNTSTGKLLILFGAVIIVAGVVVYFFGNKLSWIGNLPGDVKVEKENFRFYFPITTMILASIVISILLKIIRRFL